MTLTSSLRSISKSYKRGALPILDQLDLDIAKGETLAIMGASGSGKSTLLNLLGCLDHPDKGSYLLDGEEVFTLSDSERSEIRNRKIGFVFQAFNLIPEMTLRDNVRLPLLYRKESIDESQVDEAILAVGLKERSHHFPLELSGGEMQRGAIARALLQGPSLLLADEPTGNLDLKTRDQILRLFSLLTNEGSSVVIVTHDPDVARFADRILHLRGGVLAAS